MSLPPLSLVIPVFNEAGNIGDVLREAHEALKDHFDIEIIAVDDGSDDGTVEAIAAISHEIPAVKTIRHPKRSGKSAGLRTGFIAARGPWVATMDGDGQNDPCDIVKMADGLDLTKVGEIGLVAGVRQRRNDGWSRWIASRVANGLRKSLLRDDCPDTACGLKLLPRDLFLAMPFFDALHRYMPALTRHLGYDTRVVPVNDRPRATGESKYTNVGRAFAGAVDLLGVIWLLRRTKVPGPALLLRDESSIQSH